MAKAENLLQSSTQIAVIATDLDGKVTVFNAGAENLFGYHANDIIKKETPLMFLNPEEIKEHEETLSKTLGHDIHGFNVFKEPVIQGMYETQRWSCRHQNGDTFKAQISVTPVSTAKGETTGLLFMVTQLSRLQQPPVPESPELLYMTLNDLPNQRQFNHIADMELRRMCRDQKPISLIKLNIDSFEAFQETYDKETSERCLQKIAYVLAHRIRRAGDFLAYFGSNEFSVVLPNTDKNGTIKVAEQLRLLITDLRIEHVTSKTGPYASISLGITNTLPSKETTIAMLFAKADAGLQQANTGGGNCSRIGE